MGYPDGSPQPARKPSGSISSSSSNSRPIASASIGVSPSASPEGSFLAAVLDGGQQEQQPPQPKRQPQQQLELVQESQSLAAQSPVVRPPPPPPKVDVDVEEEQVTPDAPGVPIIPTMSFVQVPTVPPMVQNLSVVLPAVPTMAAMGPSPRQGGPSSRGPSMIFGVPHAPGISHHLGTALRPVIPGPLRRPPAATPAGIADAGDRLHSPVILASPSPASNVSALSPFPPSISSLHSGVAAGRYGTLTEDHLLANQALVRKLSVSSSLRSFKSPTTTSNLPSPTYKLGGDGAKRKSFQVRALAIKALRYQARHWVTNLCCVGLCPLVMILVSTLFGLIVQNVILDGKPSQEIVYCSKLPALNNENWPIRNVSSTFIPTTGPADVPGARSGRILHVNFLDTQNLIDLAALGINQLFVTSLDNAAECVNWFGKDYMPGLEIQPYSVRPRTLMRDAVFATQLKPGWFGLGPTLVSEREDIREQANNLLRAFLRLQQRNWAFIGWAPTVDASLLGSAPKEPVLFSSDQIPLYRDQEPSFKLASEANGILDTIEPRWFAEVSQMVGPNASLSDLAYLRYRKVPFFLTPNITKDARGQPARDEQALNEQMIQALRSTIQDLTNLDKSVLSDSAPATSRVIAFYLNASIVLQQLPSAAIYFSEVNPAALRLSATLQVGTDSRIEAHPAFPSTGMRQLVHLTQLTNGFLRYTDPGRLGSTVLTQGLRAMPVLDNTRYDIYYGGTIGRILYPFGISFLLPLFCLTLVREKEERIRVMMRMNGLHAFTYFASHYVTFLALYAIAAGVFILTGYVAQLTMFVRTEMSLLVLVFFLWGHLQVALSFVLSTIFNKSRNAFVYVFLITLCGVIISISVDQLFLTTPVPFYYLLWPPFAFYRALSLLNYSSYVKASRPYRMARLTAGDPLTHTIIAMVLETLFLLLLTAYVDAVFPGEFGVRKPWHWPISQFWQREGGSSSTSAAGSSSHTGRERRPSSTLSTPSGTSRQELEDMEAGDPNYTEGDADVQAERHRVLYTPLDPNANVVVVKRIKKRYRGHDGVPDKVAVRDITMALERDVVFGLLGPNGAGKTSLISILTGLYEASGGQATLAGYDLATQMDSIYRCIGVCPQFDILWNDLTVEDHLYFYARLKGIPRGQEASEVDSSLRLVALTGLERRQARQLSGGERRRLSIAIAFLGDPQVVFMDEPTTGLDPEVRRLIWDIIANAKDGKAIILTTHSMEEAEACCQRIGIVVNGCLQCIGSQLRLKQLYGYGFNLSFVVNEDSWREEACTWVESLLPPERWERADAFAATLTYRFLPGEGDLPTLFAVLQQQAPDHHIDAWGINQASMEDVFVRIVSQGMSC